MTVLRRNLTLAAGAAVTAGLTWALATGVVELHPATINGVVTLPASEMVTSLYASASSPAGGDAQRGVSFPPGTAGPYHFDLTVEGGDPADPANPGVSYAPSIQMNLSSPPGTNSYLYVQRSTAVSVVNTSASPSAAVNVAFSYPVVHRVTGSVSVTGGTVAGLSLQAYATDTGAAENYQSSGNASFSGTLQSNASVAAPMVPQSHVTVYGTAYLIAADGTGSERSLAQQTVDLSQGSTNVSWTVDLSNTGALQGSIALAMPSGSTAAPSSYQIYYQGASSATSGINGTLAVDPAQSSYALALTPGDYDIFMRAYLSSPSQYFDTVRTRVSIVAGVTLLKDFTPGLGVVREPLSVGGFFSVADLSAAQAFIRGPEYEFYSGSFERSGAGFIHTAPAGTWQPSYTYVSLNNQSNPALPLSSAIYKYTYNAAEAAPVTLPAGGDVSLAGAAFTLVRSNVYFDVKEVGGGPEVNVSSPSIQAFKQTLNPDGSLNNYSQVYAYGSGTPRPLSGLTMVAEPGVYTLDAHAYVNGSYTRFNGSSITFGEPITTPAGTNVGVTLTPAQNTALKIDLKFAEVASQGLTTVVETPLGPAPPEGLRTVCEKNADDITCDPVYYDISTTVPMAGKDVVVCVRRQFSGVPNGATEFLHLYHYNESVPGQEKWEKLPLPTGMTGAIDCGSGEPADLLACGCATEASCGINLDADPPKDAFLVCGVTTSFSPVTIFQGTLDLGNQVSGVEYTGPTGPPSLQQWTVPSSGPYRITATGAQGASATTAPAVRGGCGAEISGEFALAAGDVIQILVGQKGTAAPKNAGGGGGTFVIKNGVPLVIAGGGGGVGVATTNGRPGSVGPAGGQGSRTSDYSGSFIAGGTAGSGGARLAGFGAGGGGWSGNGANDGSYGDGGAAFLSPTQARGGSAKGCGADAAHGGYGGGGSGNGCFGAGGGGGYSGGGGGKVAGGGGSLNNGLNPTGREDICTPSGHGKVSIDLLIQ
jgi:hypothetical protein